MDKLRIRKRNSQFVHLDKSEVDILLDVFASAFAEITVFKNEDSEKNGELLDSLQVMIEKLK